jgi:hypothetical protein
MDEQAHKVCPRCGEAKPVEAFARKGLNGRQSYCKSCRQEYQRGRPRLLLAKKPFQKCHFGSLTSRKPWSLAPPRLVETASKRLVREAKNRPCADCGVWYPHYVMDFDHRPGEKKRANLTVLAQRGAPREVILAEIAKCDVVCSNCHRKRTYLRNKQKAAEIKTLIGEALEDRCRSSKVERRLGKAEVSGFKSQRQLLRSCVVHP